MDAHNAGNDYRRNIERHLLSFHYSQNAISGALKDLEYNTMEITNGMARRDGSGGWQKR
jgi:hypothetical protein